MSVTVHPQPKEPHSLYFVVPGAEPDAFPENFL